MHYFLKFIFGIKLYMLRTVPLSIIRRFSLYTQQWYISYRFADSLRAGSGRNVFILLASCIVLYRLVGEMSEFQGKVLSPFSDDHSYPEDGGSSFFRKPGHTES